MAKRRERPDIKVGQIWRDRDQREWSGNRRLKVVEVSAAGVRYRQVVGHPPEETSRVFTSQYLRFQTAFELIADAASTRIVP